MLLVVGEIAVKIALCVNNDKYMFDGLILKETKTESHLRDLFRGFLTLFNEHGDEFHTLDFYETDEEIDYFIFFDYPIFNPLEFSITKVKNYIRMKRILKNHRIKGKKILFIWESPLYSKHNFDENRHKEFDKLLSYLPLQNDNYVYFPYSIKEVNVEGCRIPKEEEFNNRKLSCMITSNKLVKGNGYDLRYEIIDYYENKKDEFDLYGINWEFKGIRKLVRMILGKKYASHPPKNYKGSCGSKQEVLNNYKFGYAIENVYGYLGYVSEKLFDVLISDAVPIYTGSNIIPGTIPEDIFIDIEKFNTLEKLEHFLKKMTYVEYRGYLERKIEFLHSDRFKDFLNSTNIERMKNLIYERGV